MSSDVQKPWDLPFFSPFFLSRLSVPDRLQALCHSRRLADSVDPQKTWKIREFRGWSDWGNGWEMVGKTTIVHWENH